MSDRSIESHELAQVTTSYDEEARSTSEGESKDKKDGVDYRTLGWKGAAVMMVKTQVGLGVLGIPNVLNKLGIIPGVFALIMVSAITTWSNWMIGVFKEKHEVKDIGDVGFLLCGRVGRYVLSTTFVLFWIFCASSAMLALSVAFNAVTEHALCTAIFVVLVALLGGALACTRTLKWISVLVWTGAICILAAILTLTVAVGLQDRPATAPRDIPFVSDYKMVGNPSFSDAVSALSTLVFAFAGTPGFFTIHEEMRDRRLYNRSLGACQIIVTVTYLAIGIVVYVFCGSFVASPALGSAGPVMKRALYGVAMPGLLATETLMIHFPAKFMFHSIWAGTRHEKNNTRTHWFGWLGFVWACNIIAYVVASSVPVFDELITLVGALMGTLLAFQPYGGMWLYDNWTKPRNKSWYVKVCWAIFVIVSGTFLMIGGTYAASIGIRDSYKADGGSGAWSCADNSNTVAAH